MGRLYGDPFHHLGTVYVDDALKSGDVVEDRFQVTDVMWYARDVGVDRNRHDLCTLTALGVQPDELVAATLQRIRRFVTLHNHYGDVVQLHRIGKRHQRPLRGREPAVLVVCLRRSSLPTRRPVMPSRSKPSWCQTTPRTHPRITASSRTGSATARISRNRILSASDTLAWASARATGGSGAW